MLSFLAMVFSDFCGKSWLLFRSWRFGLVRGVVLVWALATFLYWIKGDHLIAFILSGLAFQVLTDQVLPEITKRSRRREECTPAQIADWVPRHPRSSISSIGFDRPIESWAEDAIGRQDFVEAVLTRVLIDREPAVGIIADFGEGKSSVLHLIDMTIERSGKAIAVPFRTWLPGSEETFLDSLFNTATAAIRARYFLPGWRSIFKKYGRVVLGVIPKSWEFITDLVREDSQFSQIEELAELFSRLPVRVVFLLDEIDRMHEEELTVLLKILRGAPEFANVSYVCAFSKDALARIISPRNRRFGMRYLDKFFPVQLQLPRIDEDLRGYLFSDRLSAILEREEAFPSAASKTRFDDARNSLWFETLEKQLTNFRLLGEALRAFETSFHVLKNEVNPFDLLVIETIRLLLPSTYEFVYQNSRYLHDPPGGIERWNRTHIAFDEEARKKAAWAAFDGHFEGLAEADGDLARSLLARIFPSVKSYLRERAKGFGSLVIEDSERARRISDSRYFPRYFIYAVPETRFGEKEMEKFIALIRAADDRGVSAAVDATLPNTERDDLRRIDFLRRLVDRVSQIPTRQACYLMVDMAKRTSGMLYDHVAYQVTKGLVLALAARSQGTPELQRVLEDVVLSAGSDRFASDIVYSSVSQRQSTDEITDWKGFDDEHIKKVFGQRMKRRHPKPVSEILASNADDALAFSRWKVYVPEDTTYLTEFFRSAFDFDIKNLGIFLQWLLPGNVTYEGGPIKFIETFYSPATDIAARLKKAEDDKVQWDPEHTAAIQRFWRYLGGESDQSPTGSPQ
jgi:hypothetical protein